MFRTSWVTRLTDYSSTDKEGVGSIRVESNKLYKWVKFNNGQGDVAAVANKGAYYYLDTGHTNSIVTSDATDGVVAAGVFMSAIPDTYYGWILIKGEFTANDAITNGADGVPVVLSSTDGVFARANEADSTAVYKQIVGYVIDSTTKTIIADFPF